MGGRGASSGLSIGGRARIGGNILGKSLSDIQNMSDSEFVQYLNDCKNVDMPMFLNGGDAQKFIYATGINDKPTLVDDATFNKMSGTTYYRTVNEFYDSQTNVGMTAPQIVQQTQNGSLARIGDGAYGDGFYFSDNRSDIAYYANYRGNVNKSAVMEMKLNSNAKVVSYSKLRNELSKESQAVQTTFDNLKGEWDYSGISVYALKKGYNVITDGSGYCNILDRSVMTMNSEIKPA